jgi:hypothetical protein
VGRPLAIGIEPLSVTANSVSGTFLSLLDREERAAVLALATHRDFPAGALLMLRASRVSE